MLQISKQDIQQLAANEMFFQVNDKARVKATLKQHTSNVIGSQSLPKSEDKLYFIIDITVTAANCYPLALEALFKDVTVFGLQCIENPTYFDNETRVFNINRICDSFHTKLTEFNDPSGNHVDVFTPHVSILYYELSKF